VLTLLGMSMQKYIEELDQKQKDLDEFTASVQHALTSGQQDLISLDVRDDLRGHVALSVREPKTRQLLLVDGKLLARILRENLPTILNRVVEIRKTELAARKQEMLKLAEQVVMKYVDEGTQATAEFEVFVAKFVKDRPEP
jgi:hypothetical protein